MKSRTYFFVGLGLGLVIILITGLVLLQPYKFQGSLIDPAGPAADFTLTDQDSGKYQLSVQKGKIVLLFFGYIHCSDVCPVTMTKLRQIKLALGEQDSNVEFVFITVDPDRDTPEQLRDYVGNFDPGFIGLTGSSGSLEQVWRAYGVFRAKNDPSSSGDYEVDHTTRIYLVDQAGNLRLTYPYGFEAEKIVQDLNHLIKQGG